MSNNEYEVFKNNYLQHPITFLTEENLDKLETHCRKAIHYERGLEHQVVLELLERHKEHLAERESDKKRIKELEQENKTLKNFTSAIFNGNIEKEYIPKQKVKDEIEELKKHYNTDNNIRTYTLKDSYELQATILEELLEDK